MSSNEFGGTAILDGMASHNRRRSKSSDGGKHKTRRVAVNFPEDWHAVLRQLAARGKQPVLWYLIDLAKRDADAAGIPTPLLPWDEESDR